MSKSKGKNLVVIHLESLSNEIYHQERQNLTELTKLMNESMRLNYFFSSATSSLMAFTDFLHGNDAEIENCTTFDNLQKPCNYSDHLFDVLKKNNYRTLGIGYPPIWRDDIKKFDMWSSEGEEFKWTSTFDSFKSGIADFISGHNNEKPFAIYIWDLLSHLVYMDKKKSQGTNFFERRSLGYNSVNETIEHVVTVLRENDLMKDTIIVGFGDHGDDLWTHALNNGFCHGIEPYTNMIWTPAFIYDASFEGSKDYNNIASLIDLRETILNLLGDFESSSTEFSGIDLLNSNNEFIFSRNLFSNQRDSNFIDATKSKGLKKSYAIVNKDYNLIATQFGLEMYAYRIDPTNHNNLLSFFDFDQSGELQLNMRGASHSHIKKVMQQDQVDHIKGNFYKLLNRLTQRIIAKNKLINHPEERNPFDLHALSKIRDRKYIW